MHSISIGDRPTTAIDGRVEYLVTWAHFTRACADLDGVEALLNAVGAPGA